MLKFIKEVRWHRESSVTTLLYRDYTITVAAAKDEITGNFTPLIQVVWNTSDGNRGMRSFNLVEQCFTTDEARLVAFHEAKAWADRWLTDVKHSIPCRGAPTDALAQQQQYAK